MGSKAAQRWCPSEQRPVLAVRKTPSHILHLLLALVTGGVWLIVWALIAAFSDARYRCPSCGARTEAFTPALRRLGCPAPERKQMSGWMLAAAMLGALALFMWVALHPQ